MTFSGFSRLLHPPCGNICRCADSLPWSFTKRFSRGRALSCFLWDRESLSFGFHLASMVFLHFQEPVSACDSAQTLRSHIHPLGKQLLEPPNSAAETNILDSTFAMETSVRSPGRLLLISGRVLCVASYWAGRGLGQMQIWSFGMLLNPLCVCNAKAVL